MSQFNSYSSRFLVLTGVVLSVAACSSTPKRQESAVGENQKSESSSVAQADSGKEQRKDNRSDSNASSAGASASSATPSRSIAGGPDVMTLFGKIAEQSGTAKEEIFNLVVQSPSVANVLAGRTVQSIIGTQFEALVLREVLQLLQDNKEFAKSLNLTSSAKNYLMDYTRSVYAQVAQSANVDSTTIAEVTGTGIGSSYTTGFGPEIDGIFLKMPPQVRSEKLIALTNLKLAAKQNPKLVKTLKEIVKTDLKLSSSKKFKILGSMSCMRDGQLDNPEALKNLLTIMNTVLTRKEVDQILAWDKSSQIVLGRSTRCSLVDLPCDVLDSSMNTGCKL